MSSKVYNSSFSFISPLPFPCEENDLLLIVNFSMKHLHVTHHVIISFQVKTFLLFARIKAPRSILIKEEINIFCLQVNQVKLTPCRFFFATVLLIEIIFYSCSRNQFCFCVHQKLHCITIASNFPNNVLDLQDALKRVKNRKPI